MEISELKDNELVRKSNSLARMRYTAGEKYSKAKILEGRLFVIVAAQIHADDEFYTEYKIPIKVDPMSRSILTFFKLHFPWLPCQIKV